MRTRLLKVLDMLRKEKADALLVWNSEGSGQPATEWLTGFTGTWSILLIAREKSSVSKTRPPSFKKGGIKKLLITDGRYTEQSKKETRGWSVSITAGQMSALQILHKLIEQEKIGKIVFDGSVTPYSVVEELRKAVESTTPVAADGVAPFAKGDGGKPLELISRKRILQELRVVKEKEEIRILAEAAKRAGRAFMRLIPQVHVGMTEKEIAERLESLCREEGVEVFAFPTSVASGKNGALPHAKSTDKKIQKGELITIDFGIKYRGYCSDMTRMVSVGKSSARMQKVFTAVLGAQQLACTKATSGMTGRELDAVCRGYLETQGLARYFTHSTGHGIGMEVHELPIVTSHESGKNKLPSGAVITIEPGVYIPNVGGVRIEDALVLTKNGSVNLSKGITKELIVV